ILYAENRLDNLLPVFEELDKVESDSNAVFKVFYGLSLFEKNPELARKHLTEAARQFHADSDIRAELVVLSFLVFY
ncbi:MAG: hypothetical protein GWN87_10670, partial [Desulfuromonadales bacterium]|nr:hypothetical protein [Desulfuromonadales bacterium]NIS40928.1 hypothetical protein [Desulfuromonadales bacterium]